MHDRHRRGAQEADHAETIDEVGVSDDRLSVIHSRIERRFYDEGAVAMQVARRLLASGDLTERRATP